MSRWIFLLVAALPLAGCESDGDMWGAPYQYVVDNAWPFSDSQAAASQQQAEDPHCRKVAYARAADARANGFDDDLREKVYSGTYADCVAWDSAHPQTQAN